MANTIPTMLFSVNRGFVGGVNQYVLHRQAYTGKYYATTWPGHTAFNHTFSEPWSEKQPCWRHGLEDAMDYVARVSHVQRAGVPKGDIARYSKESVTQITLGSEPADLLEHGAASHIPYMSHTLELTLFERMALLLFVG